MSAVDDILAMRDKEAAPNFGGMAERAGKAVSSGAGGHFGQALGMGAGAGLAGAAMTGVGMAASSLYDAVTKARDFRAMMGSSFNEDLHEYHREKPKQFNEAYSSLRSLNPAVTKDPMTAGNYMRRMMELNPTAAGGVLLESLNATKEMPKNSPFEAFQRTGTQVAGASMAERLKGGGGRKGPRRLAEGEEGGGEQPFPA